MNKKQLILSLALIFWLIPSLVIAYEIVKVRDYEYFVPVAEYMKDHGVAEKAKIR